MPSRSRSEAAKAGWETRRERQREAEELHQRRSEAAKAGWETRRERQREEFRQAEREQGDWIIEEPIDEVGDDYY
jgi:hypothetical protein